jgi:hypothetical protein
MNNREINIDVVAELARALKELKNQVVFVGGAVVGLYANDLGAEPVRQTTDVDITLKLMSYRNWAEIQERLAVLGFHPDPFGHAICSFKYKDIVVDIMSAYDSPIGPSNHWYQRGFKYLWEIEISSEIIQILSTPYFLATKFEAFNNRGKDYRTSHDFEDIIYILENRTGIVEEISAADQDVRVFLQNEIQKVLSNTSYEELISAHIHPLV